VDGSNRLENTARDERAYPGARRRAAEHRRCRVRCRV
jgi:hypothetical protein